MNCTEPTSCLCLWRERPCGRTNFHESYNGQTEPQKVYKEQTEFYCIKIVEPQPVE